MIGVILALQLFIVIINFRDFVFIFTGGFGLVPLNEVVSKLFLLYSLLAITVILLIVLVLGKQR